MNIPHLVAMALQADGWYLRSTIIWAKPNPMPESVRDRPTKAHEYLFLLSKSPGYYYDADAVREKIAESTRERADAGYGPTIGAKMRGRRSQGLQSDSTTLGGFGQNPAGRNRRSVWTVATKPFGGAHFATFPPKLVEPCILAGTSARGCCPACGAPWVRVVEREANGGWTAKYIEENKLNGKIGAQRGNRADGADRPARATTLGWRPSCPCDAGEPVPCTVLDPFNGAGTTGLVALRHDRSYVGVDLNPKYLRMSRRRITRGLKPESKIAIVKHLKPLNGQLELFAGGDP